MKIATYSIFAATLLIGVLAATAEIAAPAAPSETHSLAPIGIKLPLPFFGGTPLNYENEHFEGPVYALRPPFLAPAGAILLSQGKPVTSSASPVYGKLTMLTDGEKGHQQDYLAELPAGTQWVQVDLGQACGIFAILCWHFHAADRVYFDVVVRIADDEAFTKNVQTVYNNDYDNSSGLGIGKDKEYIDTYQGRLIPAFKDGKSAMGRYVRFYTRGNTSDDANHYIELEIWGAPQVATK